MATCVSFITLLETWIFIKCFIVGFISKKSASLLPYKQVLVRSFGLKISFLGGRGVADDHGLVKHGLYIKI